MQYAVGSTVCDDDRDTRARKKEARPYGILQFGTVYSIKLYTVHHCEQPISRNMHDKRENEKISLEEYKRF